MQEPHDSQDPETTACRYAIRQILRMGEPLSDMPVCPDALPACLPAFGLTRGALLFSSAVPRNSERIAAFLHDLAAAL